MEKSQLPIQSFYVLSGDQIKYWPNSATNIWWRLQALLGKIINGQWFNKN